MFNEKAFLAQLLTGSDIPVIARIRIRMKISFPLNSFGIIVSIYQSK